ncbi:hypothetical protein [Anaerotruncus massiliensis (ex Togo et al. 2019)]|jgi:hypothetical protein|uniref:hypothetical protein n=1 Tax=Anaerotruncus TaxID=244127 RepID=UPI00206C1DAE|nr:hypothetical protein [Anaerotruncus massiliensis (ex Togo et al. 2019)]GKH46010.1 hypothetical protein CE91St45_05720 [Oscillospiraceae bacterium]DAY16384.1 MAG TPA: hypothetical protein [Caudoviricetes sp.]
MLDQNDIQMIAQLLEQQEKKIINQMNAIIETKVTPQIQLIAEQHGDIIARLDKVDQIDDHTDRIRTLERVTAAHTAEIKELKKAQ